MTEQTHITTDATTGATTTRPVVIDADDRIKPLDFSPLWRYRELLGFMIWRDITVRYKQTALGISWIVLQPIVNVAVLSLVFGVLLDIPSDGYPYPVFVFSAMLPWRYFSTALAMGSGSLINNSALVSKVYFPRLIIPLSAMFTPLIDFIISFFILLVVMFLYGINPITPGLLLLPPLMILALLTAFSITLWIGSLNVRYRDVGQLTGFLLQAWMYLTPILYPISQVPEAWRGLYSINPMVGVIEGFRWALLDAANPNYTAMGIGMGVVLVILVSGLIFFSKMERSFGDII